MKLELTIPQRPRLMHMLPVADLIALLFAFPLLISHFSTMGGHLLELPDSPLRIPSIDHAIVFEVLPSEGKQPQVWINQELVASNDVTQRLTDIQSRWTYGGKPVVLFKRDKSLQIEQVSPLQNELLQLGFEVYLVEKPKPTN